VDRGVPCLAPVPPPCGVPGFGGDPPGPALVWARGGTPGAPGISGRGGRPVWDRADPLWELGGDPPVVDVPQEELSGPARSSCLSVIARGNARGPWAVGRGLVVGGTLPLGAAGGESVWVRRSWLATDLTAVAGGGLFALREGAE
jgi:hypothetical protein